MASFLGGWDWGVFFTLTFVHSVPAETADKLVRNFLRRYQKHYGSWCYFLEKNPGRGGYHAHGMLVGDPFRKLLWKEWFSRFGREVSGEWFGARNEWRPITDGAQACAAYSAKQVASYAAKEHGHWWIEDREDQLAFINDDPRHPEKATAAVVLSVPTAAEAEAAGATPLDLLSSLQGKNLPR